MERMRAVAAPRELADGHSRSVRWARSRVVRGSATGRGLSRARLAAASWKRESGRPRAGVGEGCTAGWTGSAGVVGSARAGVGAVGCWVEAEMLYSACASWARASVWSVKGRPDGNVAFGGADGLGLALGEAEGAVPNGGLPAAAMSALCPGSSGPAAAWSALHPGSAGLQWPLGAGEISLGAGSGESGRLRLLGAEKARGERQPR